MNKYAIAHKDTPLVHDFDVGDNFVGDIPQRKNWLKDSFEEAVQDFFDRIKLRNHVRDPLEFMVNQHNYILIVTTDDYILSGIIRLDLYADLAGSLTFNPENLNNSAQKAAEQT